MFVERFCHISNVQFPQMDKLHLVQLMKINKEEY